ncbi:MAG: Smr/MutS family protein [Alphaproteobacteria bacterium]|nr:Smr/MutS family protein [Alphaproteobacteria bacterium]
MGKNLWKEIIETVTPLRKKRAEFGREIKPVIQKKNHGNDVDVSFISFEDIKILKRRNIIESDLDIGSEERVDKATIKNIKRGKFLIDARLDLHGKTLEVAFKTFVAFVNKNYELENRNLLIVTGKGNPEKNTGVIRKNFPSWLNNENVKDKILYVNYANILDGGDGAFYILLRKKKFI